jgi:hypothetical protein
MSDYLDSARYMNMALGPQQASSPMQASTTDKLKRLEKLTEDMFKDKAYVEKSLIQSINDEESNLKKRLAAIQDLREKVESIKFKEGDVVFHQKLGNVVIQKFVVGNAVSMDLPPEEDNKLIAYVYAKNGSRTCLVEELLPINDTTKILYSKKD